MQRTNDGSVSFIRKIRSLRLRRKRLPTDGWALLPGSATYPFFGVQPCLLTPEGAAIEGNPAEGLLAIKAPWPSTIRSVWGDHERMESTYFPFDG